MEKKQKNLKIKNIIREMIIKAIKELYGNNINDNEIDEMMKKIIVRKR